MKNTSIIILVLLLALTSFSCASKPKPIIGAEGVPQPEWVRKLPIEADVIYFVGEGRDGQTVTSKKNTARQDAFRQLAEWKSGKIKAAIKDYVTEEGETGNNQSLEKIQVTSISKAQENTSGLKDIETWINQNGQYIILFRYPKNDLKSDFKSTINEFIRNESAAYAEFKAEGAFKMLESQLQ